MTEQETMPAPQYLEFKLQVEHEIYSCTVPCAQWACKSLGSPGAQDEILSRGQLHGRGIAALISGRFAAFRGGKLEVSCGARFATDIPL